MRVTHYYVYQVTSEITFIESDPGDARRTMFICIYHLCESRVCAQLQVRIKCSNWIILSLSPSCLPSLALRTWMWNMCQEVIEYKTVSPNFHQLACVAFMSIPVNIKSTIIITSHYWINNTYLMNSEQQSLWAKNHICYEIEKPYWYLLSKIIS